MGDVIQGSFGKPKKKHVMPDPNDFSTWGNDKYVDPEAIIKDMLKNDFIFEVSRIASAFAGMQVGGREVFCCSGDVPKDIEHYDETHVIPEGDFKINLTYTGDNDKRDALITIVAWGIGDNERTSIDKLPAKLVTVEKEDIGFLAYALQLEVKRKFKFVDITCDRKRKIVIIKPLNLANTKIEIHYGPGQNSSIWKPVYYPNGEYNG